VILIELVSLEQIHAMSWHREAIPPHPDLL